MRSLSAAFVTVLEADQAPDLITLVTLNTATPIRRALWTSDVSFGGVTYTSDDGAHSEVVQDIVGRRATMTLDLQNIENDDGTTLEWSTALSTGTINGVEVEFRVVSESLLSDADAVVAESNWFISGWQLRPKGVKFKLGSPFDALALLVPARPVSVARCHWNFKEGACTSTSDKETCPKNYPGCRERHEKGSALPFGPSFPFPTTAARRRR